MSEFFYCVRKCLIVLSIFDKKAQKFLDLGIMGKFFNLGFMGKKTFL